VSRLNLRLLPKLDGHIRQPQYKPSEHQCGIVHIGIGAFHRGHQAVFTDDVLARFGGDWRIIGVSLRSPAVALQLNPQDGLYSVTQKSATEQSTRIIGAIKEVLVAPKETQKVIKTLAQQSVHIVTLTVTEKGYHYDASKGALNNNSIDIQHDIAHPDSLRSMPGFLVAACKQRMLSHGQKLTVISCDNLSENGQVCQQVVMDLAKQIDPKVASWIKHNVAFCSSMVDRIVPAITDDLRHKFVQQHGFADEGMILTEPFAQWVIENNFCTPRPQWEEVGVILVNKVADFEKMKLRTLNGSHSMLAYSGAVLGYEWIHQAVNDPLLRKLVLRQMRNEMQVTIPVPAGFNMQAYQNAIIARFTNEAIPYGTHQVAMDGSLKVIPRLLLPAIELLEKQQLPSMILVSLACWLRYLQGVDEAGKCYDIHDPQSELLQTLAKKYQDDPKALVNAICCETSIFPRQIKENSAFLQRLTDNLSKITQLGLLGFLKTLKN